MHAPRSVARPEDLEGFLEAALERLVELLDADAVLPAESAPAAEPALRPDPVEPAAGPHEERDLALDPNANLLTPEELRAFRD